MPILTCINLPLSIFLYRNGNSFFEFCVKIEYLTFVFEGGQGVQLNVVQTFKNTCVNVGIAGAEVFD